MSEYPKGLRHQAPSHELELRTPPDHSPTPGRQLTTRETNIFARLLYYSNPISASGGKDTTTITVDKDMAQDTGIHGYETR